MGLFDQKQLSNTNQVQQSSATVNATPWGSTTKPWNSLLGQIGSTLKQPAINGDSQAGYGMLRNLAGQGMSPQFGQANDYLSSLFQQAQQPIDMNPYQDAVINPMAQRATAGALSQASAAGRYGSNASTQGTAQAVSDATMPYLSQEWNNAQGRRTANQGLAMQGMGMLGQLQQMQYMPAQALLQAGQMQDAKHLGSVQERGLHPRRGRSAGRHQDLDGHDGHERRGLDSQAVVALAGCGRYRRHSRHVLLRGHGNGSTFIVARLRWCGCGRGRHSRAVGEQPVAELGGSVGLCERRAGGHGSGQALGHARGGTAARAAAGEEASAQRSYRSEVRLDPAMAGDPDFAERYALTKFQHDLSANQPTEIARNLGAMGLKPGTPEYLDGYKKLSGLGKPAATWGIVGKNGDGTEQFGWINPAEQSVTPYGAAASQQGANPYALGGKGGSEAQTNAALFGNRAAQAHDILNEREDALTSTPETLAASLPSAIGNRFMNKERQEAEQAKTNFVTAVLRKESGASISPTEFKQAETIYFPQPGDKPSVIEQKRQARISAVQGIMGGAGPGYTAPKGWEDPKTAGRKRPKLPPGAAIGQQIGGQGAAQAAEDPLIAEAKRRGLIK
jgi:hypothetical protein